MKETSGMQHSHSNWNVSIALEFIFLCVEVYICTSIGMCVHMQVHVYVLV